MGQHGSAGFCVGCSPKESKMRCNNLVFSVVRRIHSANVATAGFLLGLVASQASANLVSNGGFEGPTFPGTFSFLNGANDLSGWTFTGDLQNEASYWWKTGHGGDTRFAAEGAAAIMLNNGDRISQTLSTVAGQSYILSFNFQTLEATTLRVTIGASQPDLHDNDGTLTTMTVDTRFGGYQWRQYSYAFTATSATTSLEFLGAESPNGSGWYLDDVAVNAVPAPGAIALLGMAGLAGRRRRN